MFDFRRKGFATTLIALMIFCVTACSTQVITPTPDAYANLPERSDDVPDLPFPDNPDPAQCGIPVKWGRDEPAWVTGYYQDKLVEPVVDFYDSHLRYNVTGSAPSGTEVRIVLFQQNPVLDFYMVEVPGADPPQKGWVPAPFISFDPIDQDRN